MPNEKDKELESILTEINSGIKKAKTFNNSKVDKKSEESPDTLKVADTYLDGEKPSFIQTARIIEEKPDADDILFDRKSRHIEVAAVDKVEIEDEKPQTKTIPTKEVTKNVSKSDLKKANGTAIARHPKQKNKTSDKQKKIALFGVLIVFFVIVGVIATIASAIRLTSNIVNETGLKQELAREIFPLVIVDIPEFEMPTKLDNSAIIASSIWKFIIDEQDKSKYKKDDLGSIYVPDADIEKYIRRVYGSDVKIAHQSVDDSSVQMTYNAESKYYVIESTPKFLPYTPRVDKILKSGNLLTLRVSYILPDAMWNLKSNKKAETVDKVMEYKLKKNGNNYQMISVKLLKVTSSAQNNAVQDEEMLSEVVPGEEVPGEQEPVSSDIKETPAKTSDVSSKATSIKK